MLLCVAIKKYVFKHVRINFIIVLTFTDVFSLCYICLGFVCYYNIYIYNIVIVCEYSFTGLVNSDV